MRMMLALLIVMAFGAMVANAQGITVTVLVSSRSNISSAELGHGFDSHCPSVHIGTDAARANYTLEAINNELAVRKPCKFALFDSKGDRSSRRRREDYRAQSVMCANLFRGLSRNDKPRHFTGQSAHH
jgi:hypothetical protein